MKRAGAILIALSLWGAVLWLLPPQPDLRVVVRDLQRPQTITLTKCADQGTILGIWMGCVGWTEGEATISWMEGDEPYRTEKVKGNVRFAWGGEWYTDVAEIRYQPATVQSGHLVIRYRFSGF